MPGGGGEEEQAKGRGRSEGEWKECGGVEGVRGVEGVMKSRKDNEKIRSTDII